MTGIIGVVAIREAIDILIGNRLTLTNGFWNRLAWTNQTVSIWFNGTLRVRPAVKIEARVATTTVPRQAIRRRTSSAIALWSLSGVPRR